MRPALKALVTGADGFLAKHDVARELLSQVRALRGGSPAAGGMR